jgi:hypothetical protein
VDEHTKPTKPKRYIAPGSEPYGDIEQFLHALNISIAGDDFQFTSK